MDIYTLPRLRTELLDPRNEKVFATVESLIPTLNKLTTEMIEKAQREALENFDWATYINTEYTRVLKKEVNKLIEEAAKEHALARFKRVAEDNYLKSLLGIEEK